jgi:prepilin-type N-terminal cleavage/methylation domain-containing protein
MKMGLKRRGGGFSLVELLVVIAIVAVLVSMVIPALSGAREVARDALCKSNQRQLGIAGVNYRNDFGVYLPSFQSQTDDPMINSDGGASTSGRLGSSGQGLLHSGGYISIPLGLYSSSATSSRAGALEAARRSTVSLCPSGKYYGPPQAPMAMAYIIFPESADGLDAITRTQDGYDVSRAGTTIKDGAYDPLTAYIQSYSMNDRFSVLITVPGATPRNGYTAVKKISNAVRESQLLVWAEYFQRDGLNHGYRVNMTNLRGTSSEMSMPRWAYFRTPHGSLRTGNWSALDGHVGTMRVDELRAAWSAANVTAAALELPFEF